MKGPSEIDNRFLVVTFLCVGLNGSVKLNFFFQLQEGNSSSLSFWLRRICNKRTGQNIAFKIIAGDKNSQN